MAFEVTDLTGQKFGRMAVISLALKRGKTSLWNCICDCGKRKIVLGNNLRSGNTRSCGCYMIDQTKKANTIHGKTDTKGHLSWTLMLSRCYYPENKDYHNYGGRGIRVCKRWHEFVNFDRDMGSPSPGFTLDRKDNNEGYNLTNCRWATRKEQSNNRRDNIVKG